MKFEEWYRKKYLGRDFGFERHIKGAWDAAISEAVKVALSEHTPNCDHAANNIRSLKND